MIQSVFEDIQVAGIMTAVPKKREILMERYKESFGEEAVESFSKMVGVRERRISLEEQTASDLAFVAARELIKKKNIDKSEVGILVFVTQNPDYPVPATACVLHERLRLSKNCIAFDVNMGCSGYVYGMQIICSLLSTTNALYGLLLVGDTSNNAIAPEDKSSAMLFGEGGSAILLQKNKNLSKICIGSKTDGTGYKSIIVPAGGARNRKASHERTIWGDGNIRSDFDLYMKGVDIFTFAIFEVPALIQEFFEKTGEKKEDYDSYVFHQANVYILKQIVKRSKLPKDRVPISMERYGNTSVTSIPLTICDRYGEAEGKKKLKFFTCGFGIGLSWGIASFQMDQEDIYPIIETDEYYKEGGVSHD